VDRSRSDRRWRLAGQPRFGGGALLDPFTARVMRDTPADVVSLELAINPVNTDL
jgi:hypothetical protein